MSQIKWKNLVPSKVFTLNCTVSRATKCIPYQVIFGRSLTLPVVLLFDSRIVPKNKDSVTPKEYVEEVGISLKEVWKSVTNHLKISKEEMMRQYNKNVRFNDHKVGAKVWLKNKFVKSGENKLAPKRTGPLTVIERMPC